MRGQFCGFGVFGRATFGRAVGIAVIALWCGTATARAQTVTDAQTVVDKATITVKEMRGDPSFGNAPDLLRRARAVMVVPEMVKGGFFIGGEGGQAVLLERTARGWSEPAFYTLGAASFGLQIGIETAHAVMFVMSDRALKALLQDQFTLGGKASLAIVTVGSNVSAATTTALTGADIIVWSKAQGAYAGLTLEGSIIKQRHEYDRAYYGRQTTTGQVFASRTGPAGATGLRAALAN